MVSRAKISAASNLPALMASAGLQDCGSVPANSRFFLPSTRSDVEGGCCRWWRWWFRFDIRGRGGDDIYTPPFPPQGIVAHGKRKSKDGDIKKEENVRKNCQINSVNI